jgi:hypothetical protein
VVEPNRLNQAAVPNTIGAGGPAPSNQPLSSPVRGDDLASQVPRPPYTIAELEAMSEHELDALDPDEVDRALDAAPVEPISDAELNQRIETAVRTRLADQTQTITAAKRRGRIGFVAGLLLAAVGIPLFFGASLVAEEVGIALICLGVGIALVSVLLASARADVATSRQSTGAAVVTTMLLPHTAVVWLIALGLIAFGLLMVVAAVTTG